MVTFCRAALAAALAVGVVAGCRSPGDLTVPGSRGVLVADRSAVTTTTGSGVSVSVSLRDANGSVVPINDILWVAADTTVAVVVRDMAVIPGSFVARATIVGRARTGGWTYVTVYAAKLVDTVRVAVLPSGLDSSLVAYAGAVQADTIVRAALPGPPALPPDTLVFAAPDTLVLRGTDVLHFDTGSAYVYVQSQGLRTWGVVTSVTPARLAVVFAEPARGQVVVNRLLLTTGDSILGTVRIDSLLGDSVTVSRQRFSGTVSVVGDTMTVTAGPGTLFDGYASVTFDTSGAAVMSQTASQLQVLSPVAFTGYPRITQYRVTRSGPGYGYVSGSPTRMPYTMRAATFPGEIVTGGRLLDTVTVYATANARFDGGYYGLDASVPATYPCGGCRYGVIWVASTPDSLKFVSPVGVNGPMLIGLWSGSGVRVKSALLSMYTREPLVVSGTSTGEPNEPGNDSAAGATAYPAGPGYAIFGALNGTTDSSDYYTFPVPAAARVMVAVSARVSLGVAACDSLVAGGCGTANDLLKSGALVPAGSRLWLRVTDTSATPGYVTYELTVWVSLTGVRAP
jgi:hypothetical protein